jgi:tetratricopeptide (TPR) repeat protein
MVMGHHLSTPALAHQEIEEQIRVIDKLIEARPLDASLYLRRGELYRIHRDWDLAEKDYLQARKLDPDLPTVDFSLGRMHFEAGDLDQARQYLDRFLEARPGDPKGREIRGQVLMKQGRYLAAADDFTVALDHAVQGTPRPELYLLRARALVTAGPKNLDRALESLEEGLEDLGSPVTLQLYALELETNAKRYDAALRRVDRLAAGSVRKEPWLMRKGALLEAAGRPDEAIAVYREALEAIETLSPRRRGTKAVQRLETEALTALERLGIDDEKAD